MPLRFRKHHALLHLSVFIILLAMFSSPVTYSSARVNWALFQHLASKESDLMPVYEHVQYQFPKNNYYRFQLALALFRRGEYNGVIQEMLQLNGTSSSTSIELLFTALANEKLHSSAVDEFQKHLNFSNKEQLDFAEKLSPAASAAILLSYLESSRTIDADVKNTLIVNTFPFKDDFEKSLIVNEYEAQFINNNVRESPLYSTLNWLSRPIYQFLPMWGDNSIENTLVNEVAEMLQVQADQIKLSEEYVINGNFERNHILTNTPEYFGHSFMSDGTQWNRGYFVVGLDIDESTHGGFTIRIDGITIESKPNYEPARAGIWYLTPITVKTNTPYLISLRYKTHGFNGQPGAAIWLSYEPDVIWGNDMFLPPTDGEWVNVRIIGWNRLAHDSTIQPLLRSFTIGNVWFDDLSIRSLKTQSDIGSQKNIIKIWNPACPSSHVISCH